MDGDIQVISDDEGIALIGDAGAIEQFLTAEKLPSRDLGLGRLTTTLRLGSGAAQTASEVASQSGRWVKLTNESAAAVKKYGLRESAKTGRQTGVLKGDKGKVAGFVEFVRGPGAFLSNPANLAGAAGLMAQVAMQQTMDEIIDYLAAIDGKVEDVLRAQKDAVLADMIGVDLVIDEAMTVRGRAGRVSEVTWSKVDAVGLTIARTQAYALRQIEALTEKVERESKVGDVARVAREAEATVKEWLAVLAHCFMLQEASAVLELDRVLDAEPDELDRHREGLAAARATRLDRIGRATHQLVARMDAAARSANTRVLAHPAKAPAVVRSSNDVRAAVIELHERLGIDADAEVLEVRTWGVAAREVRSSALTTGAQGLSNAKRVGGRSLSLAKSTGGNAARRLAERTGTLKKSSASSEPDQDQDLPRG